MYKIIGGNEAEYGPVSGEQLRQWISEGRADANTRAKLEGTADWKPLREFPEFADVFAPPAVPSTASGPPLFSSAPPPLPAPVRVPNYLPQAILCTVCCCMPLGVVAMVFASQVNSKLARGDYQGAVESSKRARLCCWISFILGLVMYPLFFKFSWAHRMNTMNQ